MNSTILRHQDGKANIAELPNGKRRITIELNNRDEYCQAADWTTSYSIALIEKVLEVKGMVWLCDEILREENPATIQAKIKSNILNYLKPEDFRAERMLDFGCGCGASTMNLAKLFPELTIVGVELDPKSMELAKARAEFYGFDQITFFLSPQADKLPANIGKFDFVNLNAVYEHLLPNERKRLLPALWSLLKPGGVLFVSETPYRFSMFETHTTGLPLANFVPDWLLSRAAHWFSKRIEKGMSWETMLRNGIRGGTENQILRILRKSPAKPRLLGPQGTYLESRIESWPVSLDEMDSCFRLSLKNRLAFGKRVFAFFLKVLNRAFDFPYAADLSLAVSKGRE